MATAIELVIGDEGALRASSQVMRNSLVSKNLHDALKAALVYDDAIDGKVFTAADDVDNGDNTHFQSLKVRGTVTGGSSTSSGFREPPRSEAIAWSSLGPRPTVDGQIDQTVLEEIRSFKPEAGDKVFTFTAFEPSLSSVLAHRQRIMRLMRMDWSVVKIKEAVDNKSKRLVADPAARPLISGIPRKRLELCLSDSVLCGHETSYSRLLNELFSNGCVPSDLLLEVVPDYIGLGGKSEKERPSEVETARRRKAFLTQTANYLKPLYTNAEFRAMINAARTANKSGGATA